MSDANVIRELTESAEAIGIVAGNEDQFRAVVDAFRAKDADTFQRLLGELNILDRCERVCYWLRSKECVLLCLELCGPPLEVELPDLRQFAQITARISADEELVERLAAAVEERDAKRFKALISELKIERFCHLLCHWACIIHYRLICKIVCTAGPFERTSLVDELSQAGVGIGMLAANESIFAEATKAAFTSNCDRLRGSISQAGLSGHCHYICEWFCSLRCIRVCLLICRRFPIERIENPLSEAFAFAQISARVSKEAALLDRLSSAVESEDEQAFGAIVGEQKLGLFCMQLCHLICFFHCRRFCFCVCPPRSAAYFIKIGQYEYSEVYPLGGTTPKIESQLTGTGLTNDKRAFHSTLRLNGGYSLQTGAPQMEYRFETIPTDAAGAPTAPNWVPVLAAGTEATIIGYDIITVPVLTFTPVFATLDAQGWIKVPLASPSYAPTGDLLLLDTTKLTNPPNLDQTGVVAGAHASHPLANDVYFGIRMRVRNLGDASSEFDAGTCHHIAIDNTLYDNVTHQPAWRNLTDPAGDLAVYLVDIKELLGPLGCSQITDQLHVLFTAAHPNLGVASLRMDGPGGPFAFTMTPDGSSSNVDFFGVATPNGFVVKNLKPCAYIVTLTVDVLLTNGDNDPGSLVDEVAFCKK